jgi:hypothetical protein
MGKKVFKVVEILGIIIGITGMTLDKLADVSPAVFIGSLVVLTLALLLAGWYYVTEKDRNRFVGKDRITEAWRALLGGASRSVAIFAGDVSWITDHRNVIVRQHQTGVVLRVTCRPPTTDLLRSHVRALLDAGAEVKYYPPSESNNEKCKQPTVRGLVVDAVVGPRTSTALTVKKDSMQAIDDRGQGIPGREPLYSYEARRYLPGTDGDFIDVLRDLFDSLWDQSVLGMVLEPVATKTADLISILGIIPQYKDLKPEDVEFRDVSIPELWSPCTYVKEYKFAAMQAIVLAYQQQKMKLMSPCICLSHSRRSLMLPPILEAHGDKLVIIDGTHRLYYLKTFTPESNVNCIVIHCKIPLPSVPLPFSQVVLSKQKLPRERVFPNYNPRCYRDIDALNPELNRRATART